MEFADFGELIGPLWRQGEGEQLRFGLLAAQKHLNFNGIVHGGMLATFADQSMGMTALEATGKKPHATIELNVQYISAVHAGEFVETQCEVVRVTRAIIFMRTKMMVGMRIVGTASGIWKISGKQ